LVVLVHVKTITEMSKVTLECRYRSRYTQFGRLNPYTV